MAERVLTLVLSLAGGIFGAATLRGEGLWIGLLCGYLFARAIRQGRQVEGLGARIAALETAVRQARAGSPDWQGETATVQETAPTALRKGIAVTTEVATEAAEPAVGASPGWSQERPDIKDSAQIPASGDRWTSDSPWGLTGAPAAAWGGGQIFKAVQAWLTSGNLLVKVGVVTLFFGVGFLVKYVAERTEVPIEVRLIGVALGAVGMLMLGWRLRERRPGYALVIQGGAVGVIYLTLFAAFKLYQLVPGVIAFGLLVAVSALAALLAVLQESRSLAIFGVSGGFLAPILASTGGGSHVMLFSYYAVINAGILGVAWYRAWRELNLVGWAFTFAIGAVWGAQFYRPEHFATTEPFLILFFLSYVAIAVLFAWRQPPDLKGLVDGTLVFGTPLIAFAMQSWLVRGTEFATAGSAVVAGGFYILLSRWLLGRDRTTFRLLVEAFVALGVVFITLAIPLALDGRWTAATWALEGAGIFWIGLRQQRLLARLFGLGLQIAAALAYLSEVGRVTGAIPVLNSAYLGALMISAAGWISAWLMHQAPAEPTRREGNLMWPAAAWAIAWWYAAGLLEIDAQLAHRLVPAVGLGFVALSSVIFNLIDRRLNWKALHAGALVVLPALLVAFVGWVLLGRHPAEDLGWVAWPAAFGAGYWALWRFEDALPARLRNAGHLGTLWLLVALLSWELSWQVDRLVGYQGSWTAASWAIVPLVVLATAGRGKGPAWPVNRHFELYAGQGMVPLGALLLLWTLYANFAQDGSAAPLPYIPLLNPLDLTVAAVFLTLAGWVLVAKRDRPVPALADLGWSHLYVLLGVPGFVWANAIVLRSLHHYAGVPFDLGIMLRSTLVQAALSLLWTLTSFALMFLGTRRSVRVLWFTGSTLLAVVVGKLFTVDIANVGGLHRIVSFIGVALLMLVIGYLAPLPPKPSEREA